MKQLLVDTILFSASPRMIAESERKNDGKVIVSGVLQRAEAKNQNGRVYPKKILMREVKKYAETNIKENRALGELDHPDSSVINLKNVSHNVLGVDWKGNDVVGTVEILPTPSGNILKQLLGAGIRLGISSRGLGSVEEISENTVEVQEDFELIGWDFVSNPSTQGAFMYPDGYQNEGLIREGISLETISKIDPKIQRIHNNITNIICEIGNVCECIFGER
jgi:Prohead core protein serine protease